MIHRSAVELRNLVASGEASATEIARSFLEHVHKTEPKVRSFLRLDSESILNHARLVDEKRARGEKLGRLAGVPIAVKDLICERGEQATCGSRILENYRPPYDAHVIERLRAEDAVLFGRLNMDEFAMGSSCENSAFQKTFNPWNVACVPGGSSGGSAAAVAARQVPLALGTDTGGSIRQPAACCGIVGLKPTYGRVSRFGLIAYASSLDQIGPMSRNVEDNALLLSVLAGHDPRDSTSVDTPVPDYLGELESPVTKLRIGVAQEFFGDGLDPEVESAVRKAIAMLEDLGATVSEISLPHAQYGIAAYYLTATAEASSNLARYDGTHFGYSAKQPANLEDLVSRTRGEAFGAEVKRRILLGAFALSAGYRDAYYIKALQVRRLIRHDFDAAFRTVDVILGPTAPTPAFKIGEKSSDPLAMYLSDIYTVSTNLAGLPGISLPCGFTQNGLPIGLQLQGPAFGESILLRAARMYEKATHWHARMPTLVAESTP
jgi:aspartyl-tRNA(Asn)/glutamyl-tRNA(Gln) amidotransferase subunit A